METNFLNQEIEGPEVSRPETFDPEIEQADLKSLQAENLEELYPIFFRNSGLYVRSNFFYTPKFPVLPLRKPATAEDQQSAINIDMLDAEEKEEFKIHPYFLYEELRLDIDGRYPLMMASGYLKFPGVHYIAKLKKKTYNSYTGKIWYKYGNVTSFPYTIVNISISNSIFPGNKKVKVVFSGGQGGTKTSVYKYKSRYYDRVNFEYDCEQGVSPILDVNTHDHPNRPVSLPNESLKLQTIYQRSGFNVSRSGDGPIPTALSGTNGTWSDMEMHDAMQVYWSKFNNAPNWALWVFFAKLHDSGNSLGGIMFDDIGPNHRQGTAIFNDSFIDSPPPGDPSPVAAVERIKFWTAVHEMGHAFNLAHSWQKNFPTFGNSWIPLANEPEARSFMNYPYGVSGGQTAFFSSFEYRFSNNELLFLRHAPRSFVQMGNSQWFVNHGFENETPNIDNKFSLEISFNEADNIYEYMEPVYLNIKLRNNSGAPLAVERHILKNLREILIRIEKPNGDVVNIQSFVHYLFQEKEHILLPDEALEESHFISAGTNDWYIKDSGRYKVSAMLSVAGELYRSNVAQLDVLLPVNTTQQVIGTQYFTEEVARILFFNGSKILERGNEVLEEIVEKTPDTNVAIHAAVALAQPYMTKYKTMDFEDTSEAQLQQSASDFKASFETHKVDTTKAINYLSKATSDADKFIKTRGSTLTEEQLNSYMKLIKSSKTNKSEKVEKALAREIKKRSDK